MGINSTTNYSTGEFTGFLNHQQYRLKNKTMENGPGLKMYFLLKMVMFHCYVSLPKGFLATNLNLAHNLPPGGELAPWTRWSFQAFVAPRPLLVDEV